ncbi:hypothetical protein EC957_009029 [Mortierella hygrophila]|uniref:J domain-containing protein n=1 Tax=Mortierella hygrophila TaxID=979708 RepID=A0A9P6FAT0_9FUNG|nr:hypothetical protein EC957_009029 [Mortierella hygrophila]
MSFIPNLTYSIASTVWSGTSAALGKQQGKPNPATTTTVTGPGSHHHHHHHSHHHSHSRDSTGNNKRYSSSSSSHSRRQSSTNYNFSRSQPNGPSSTTSSSTTPMTPPHSPNHYSHSGSNSERRPARKRNPSISSTPRTPPSSPQLDSASAFEGGHSPYNFSRKKPQGGAADGQGGNSSSSRSSSQQSSANGYNKRNTYPNAHTNDSSRRGNHNNNSSSNNSSNNNSAKENANQPPKAPATAEERYKIVDDILETENLYRVLAVNRNATSEEIRRAYIAKSRVCHPDKFPEYPRATEAFQKLSLAYETLSKPSSRFVYDSTGGSSGKSMLGSDETLQSVLSQVFFEFMDGDFEVIRNMINTMNNTAGGVRLGDDVIGVIEEMFLRLRFVLHGCKKYMTLVHDQVQQLGEIHHSMRSLAYLDVLGRFRLTLKLSKVMLTIPMIIQDEMKREIAVAAALEGASEQDDANTKKNAGIVGTVFLNDRVETVLKKVVSAIETGERWV